MNILQLNTGLFPAAQTVDAALRQTTGTHRVTIVDIARREMKETDWDAALQAILAADRIVSI
jgi:hypothetical protein